MIMKDIKPHTLNIIKDSRSITKKIMEEMSVKMNESIAELRQTSLSGRTRGIAWRKSQLRAILNLLNENENRIFEALHEDLGKHPAEAFRDEVGVLIKSVNHALSNIEKWAAPKKASIPLVFFPAKGQVLPEPLGTVLVISSWNFPISLSLEPVIGAISAGNTVVLKPSELAPACSALLAEKIPLYMDGKAIRVIEGGSEVSEKLIQQKWGKIFFTGSSRVGRLIMSAAAQHLTPVTLELGGKCPVILDSLSGLDLKLAIKRIIAAKWGPCGGQACISSDYVLVEQRFASIAVELLKKFIKKFYGDNLKNLKYLSRIVNQHHFNRIHKLLQDPGVAASIVYGGSLDEENMMIEPTILLDPPLDAEIMTEEIFGPLLPIITLERIEDSIEFIRGRPSPLVIYAFTRSESIKQKILSGTSSGAVAFNDTMIQFLCEGLPFGGVGQSGFGRYHGKYSFDTFSHEKAVMYGSYFPEIEPRYPPWNDFKMEFIRLAYSLNIFGLLLLLLGIKRRSRSNH
ncbi:dehydrogenase [Lithospermum erythrorhizon]|uniref:Aldehyde dehydrogenase n=1 Tax=Lithospermum erythrorhizon TaxID=34254 RepID=A0AAV3QMT6_LITER